jgi:hypothetical protein
VAVGAAVRDPVPCRQYRGRPITMNDVTAIFEIDGDSTAGYHNWNLEGDGLPPHLRSNLFVIQQRANSDFYFASYFRKQSDYNGDYIITFRRRDGAFLSSWYLSGFDSCNLDNAAEPLYKGVYNFVLTEYPQKHD